MSETYNQLQIFSHDSCQHVHVIDISCGHNDNQPLSKSLTASTNEMAQKPADNQANQVLPAMNTPSGYAVYSLNIVMATNYYYYKTCAIVWMM